MSDITATLTQTVITATVTNPADIVASLGQTLITATLTDGIDVNGSISSSPIAATLVSGGTVTATITETPISATVINGIADHVMLTNLDYASSGHTGFQATLTADVDYLTPGTAASTYQPIGSYLTDAPSDGTTYGRNNGAWTAVSSGVTDHSALSNLDYASAGHTGFQSALSFPLTPDLGGTGIANAAGSTLTLGAATTVPSPGGTVALLGTANVFTTQQMVGGTSDQIQLRVWAHSTQTANIISVEKSDATVKFAVSKLGAIGVNTSQPGDAKNGLSDANTGIIDIYGVPGGAIGGASTIRLIPKLTGVGRWYLLAAANDFVVTSRRGNFEFYDAESAKNRFIIDIAGRMAISPAPVQPLTHRLLVEDQTTVTNAVTDTLKLLSTVSTASTGGGTGFGVGQSFYAETATEGQYKQIGYLTSSLIVATTASYTGRLAGWAVDYSGQREGWRVDSDGSQALLGFYAHAAVAQQVLATGAGASVDDVITALQALGLVKQS